jgi:glucose/arabinose dehydrogenase
MWAKGLRNPFRFSFDSANGDLYIGDVGQNQREEIDAERADSAGGLNYGWDVMEGTNCFSPNGNEPPCDSPSLIDPIHEYGHTGNQCSGAVTGGTVYRGAAIPGIDGLYFFADSCDGRIWSLRWNRQSGQVTEFVNRSNEIDADVGSIDGIVAIVPDDAGELYFVDIGGEIFRLVPEPGPAALSAAALSTLAALARRRGRRA